MKLVAVKLTMTKGNDLQVPWTGYVIVPGLAVCKTPKRVNGQWVPAYRRWYVVHVPSGYRVGTGPIRFVSRRLVYAWDSRSRAAAAATAEELGELADWTKSASELEAVPGLREKVRAVFRR